ncbi:neprilysin-1-like [Ixodes scapularis]|uniref:neprilysin-1-like n=1 Tax=Ixodes scapularis TaxID=6945 RepID=UPI001C3946E8|nr:neprilysin-1-like [Ixodes scapularis]
MASAYEKSQENPWMAPYNYMRRSFGGSDTIATVVIILGVAACVLSLYGMYNRNRYRSSNEDDVDEVAVLHGPWAINRSTESHRPLNAGFKLCKTNDCKWESRHLVHLSHPSQSACNNFYDFVCSVRWREPARKDAASTNDFVIEDVQDIVWEYIKSGRADGEQAVSGVVDLWKGCMDHQAIGNLGTGPFKATLSKLGLASWPLDSSAPVTSSDIWRISGLAVRLLGLHTLFNIKVERDKRPSLVITLGRTATSLSIRDFQDNRTVTKFLARVARTMRFIKPDDNTTDIAAIEVLNVVLRLANLNSARKDEATYGSKSTFFVYLNTSLVGLVDVSRSNVFLMLQSPKYAQGLLQVMSVVPFRVMLNYIGYRVIDDLWIFSPEDVGEVITPGRSRERNCLVMAERALDSQMLQLGYMALKTKLNFTNLARLTKDTKRRLVETVEHLSWMDRQMKKTVVEKLTAIEVTLFFPDWIKKSSIHFRPVEINRTQVLVSYQDLMAQTYAQHIASQTGAAISSSFTGRLSDIKCSYDPESGALYIPVSAANITKTPVSPYVALLQVPRIGVRLAHCLLEAALGTSDQHTYPWTPLSRSRYKVVRQCFNERYSAVMDPLEKQIVYELPDVVNRNIYEHVAVSMAHLEFREGVRRLSNNYSDYRLAAAQHWSSDQLFFVYYAESLCEKYNEEWTFRQFLRRKESPMAQRVNLALSHDATFHRAFGCRRGLGMRPVRSCSFW